MTDTASETLSVVVEREFPHPPEKVWRALTQPQLIEEWLMKNDLKPVVGQRFNFRADFLPNGSLDCEVLAVEPPSKLSYTWDSASGNPAFSLKSVVTWTLTSTSKGTHLRMEQSGFRQDQAQAYQGAKWGWPRQFDGLEQLLARMD
jgi:uncharacterized protein YndB with AHSA1/START domain